MIHRRLRTLLSVKIAIIGCLVGLCYALVLACSHSISNAHYGLDEPLSVSHNSAGHELFLSTEYGELPEAWIQLLRSDFEQTRFATATPIDRAAILAEWFIFYERFASELSEPQRTLFNDRLICLTSDVDQVADQELVEYRNAVWSLMSDPGYLLGQQKMSSKSAQEFLLNVMATGHPLADAAALVLARNELLSRNWNEADQLLQQCHPQTESQRDQLAYLQTWTTLVSYRFGPLANDQSRVDSALLRYLHHWPTGAWRADCIGWQAFLIYKKDPLAALPLYQQLTGDTSLPGGFALGIDSLRFVFAHWSSTLPKSLQDDHRFAALALFNAITQGSTAQAQGIASQYAGRPEIFAALDRLFLPSPRAAPLPQSVHLNLAELHALYGDSEQSRHYRELADSVSVTPMGTYLRLREELKQGHSEHVYNEIQTLNATSVANYRDVLLRIGAAREAHDPTQALRCYIWADSGIDVGIVAECIMKREDLQKLCDNRESLIAHCREYNRWPESSEYPDYMPELRRRLGFRLARADQFTQAQTYVSGDDLTAISELHRLYDQASAPDAGPVEYYALGAFYYHRGREALLIDCEWHQWASGHGIFDRPEGALARSEFISATGFHRARTWFAKIIEQWPDSPEAPRALYSLASCHYWLATPKKSLRGSNDWWKKQEPLIETGDQLMQQLAQRYPTHPLATSTWVQSIVAHATPMPSTK